MTIAQKLISVLNLQPLHYDVELFVERFGYYDRIQSNPDLYF